MTEESKHGPDATIIDSSCCEVEADEAGNFETEAALKPRNTIRELIKICHSRTELKLLFQKYRYYAAASILAFGGLIISIRMVNLTLIRTQFAMLNAF